MSTKLFTAVQEALPEVNELVRLGDRKQSEGNLRSRSSRFVDGGFSRSDLCEWLSLEMFNILDAQGLPARRELHRHPYSNQWHFILAHSFGDPTDSDIITDLNPWTFADEDRALPDFLHAPRDEAYSAVIASGSHRVRAECLLTSTIAFPHTLNTQRDGLNGGFQLLESDDFMEARVSEGFDFSFTDWRIE